MKSSDLPRRVLRTGLVLTLAGACAVLPLGLPWSAGVVAGGAVLILSVMGIGMVVRGALRAGRPSPAAFGFYLLRLLIIFGVLAFLVKRELASVGGILVGLTLVLGAVVFEGWRTAEGG